MVSRITRVLLVAFTFTLAACGSDSSSRDREKEPPPPEFDFSAADQVLQDLIDEDLVREGISYILVERDLGVIHERAFGDHAPNIITMLASTSKVPSAMLLMALDSDESLDFDIDTPVENYLPWDGVYGDRTVGQMLSNTSGIPGLSGLVDYGPHLCQFMPDVQLRDCARILYAYELPGSRPPETRFDYGGSQWQLAGAVAEVVSGSTWAQAFDAYIATPCELETFRYGNMWTDLEGWNGSLDSLRGLDNPHIEGGAVSSLQDYARILLMHLNDGMCGEKRIMSPEAAVAMREDRAAALGQNYGLGWWIDVPDDGSEPTLFYDPGFFGAIAWIDTARGIGGFVTVDEYLLPGSGDSPVSVVRKELIDLVAAEVDRAREEAGQ